MALLACCSLQAAFADAPVLKGTRLADYLDSLAAEGLRILYSSDLVTADQVLLQEPDSADPASSLKPLLRPYGLTLVDGPAGSWLVVRDETHAKDSAPVPSAESLALPEIVVTSSLHRLQYIESGSHTYLERELATRIPAAAEEAVRLTNRLPGTASGGISSRNHIRGGEVNEVLFLLDGLRLYEPYHLKDFQSVATIVNSSAIS
ncbi:MAG: hypothetical protein GY949_06215, partial [Gammaproteobacteria bacterium]|nr:hypothetical protein [Gammaproteobacteria bacterium]